jgi:hypothetical protein
VSSDQPTNIGPPGFASRPVTAADEAVLLALFGAMRAGELHLDGWEPALRARPSTCPSSVASFARAKLFTAEGAENAEPFPFESAASAASANSAVKSF